MKIINHGKKDYYDYLSGLWGEDPLIIYDRYGDVVLDNTKYSGHWYDEYFYEKALWNDIKREHPKNEWQIVSYVTRNDDWYKLTQKERKKMFSDYKEGRIFSLVIEVGTNLYIIEIDRYLDDENPELVHITPRLVKKIKMEKRSKAPISIYPCRLSGYYTTLHCVEDIDIEKRIDDPVLIKTWISKIIPAEDMWKELYEYLGSLRDKPIVDSRTNDEHIESNGFDKKISFRNVK